MKKIIFLFGLGITILCGSAVAQKANTDSLALVSQIGNYQLKLGKMQNEVEQKTKNKQDANIQAQKSADENSNAAAKLTDDPNSKKLARKADNTADDAKTDARTARKEERRLNALNKDISDLKTKINSLQAKLDKFTGNITPPLN